jgi:hypothetical protein
VRGDEHAEVPEVAAFESHHLAIAARAATAAGAGADDLTSTRHERATSTLGAQ